MVSGVKRATVRGSNERNFGGVPSEGWRKGVRGGLPRRRRDRGRGGGGGELPGINTTGFIHLRPSPAGFSLPSSLSLTSRFTSFFLSYFFSLVYPQVAPFCIHLSPPPLPLHRPPEIFYLLPSFRLSFFHEFFYPFLCPPPSDSFSPWCERRGGLGEGGQASGHRRLAILLFSLVKIGTTQTRLR